MTLSEAVRACRTKGRVRGTDGRTGVVVRVWLAADHPCWWVLVRVGMFGRTYRIDELELEIGSANPLDKRVAQA